GAAAAREADLIVALQPRFNASYKGDGRWVYLVVEPGERTCFTITRVPVASKRGRVYGCFMHLGRGVSSRPAIACSDGYTALLRLLWATGGGERFPAAIAGPSPPDEAAIRLAPGTEPLLHRFLNGTSRRLLEALAAGCDEV